MNSMMPIPWPILRPNPRSLSSPFDACTAGRTDHRRVRGVAGQDQAVTGPELELTALLLEHESDRAGDAVQHLLVAVAVRGVPVPWPVRPRVAARRLGLEPGHQSLRG